MMMRGCEISFNKMPRNSHIALLPVSMPSITPCAAFHTRIREENEIYFYLYIYKVQTHSVIHSHLSLPSSLFVVDGNAMPDTCLIIMIDFYLIFPRKTKYFPLGERFTHDLLNKFISMHSRARNGHIRGSHSSEISIK